METFSNFCRSDFSLAVSIVVICIRYFVCECTASKVADHSIFFMTDTAVSGANAKN